jgi:bacillithiol biosynthesis deacetylase BshB1
LELDVLFFAAHPDDVELSCGGTAAKLAKIGKKIGIVDLTEGELSTRGSVTSRKKEAAKAAKILGISKRINLSIPDGNIENNPPIRIKIIKILRDLRPEIIFFPHYHDRHPDHFHTHELVKEAAFYSGLQKIHTTLNGKPQKFFRPKKNYYFMQTYTFEPNVITDITEVYDIKVKAISAYSSQFFNLKSKEPDTFISDPKFLKYLEARARFYGFQIGVEYGEPFFTEEKIKVKVQDLFNI